MRPPAAAAAAAAAAAVPVRCFHSSSSSAARVLSAVPSPPSPAAPRPASANTPGSGSGSGSGSAAAQHATASRLWSNARKNRTHGNGSSTSNTTTSSTSNNATIARARARAQLLIKLGIDPTSALRATNAVAPAKPANAPTAPTALSRGRGRKTLKALRKATIAASIGGINLASVRAGALASGLGLSNASPSTPSRPAPPPPPPRERSASASSLRFPTRIERAAQNARAVQRATRAAPLMAHVDPSQAAPPVQVDEAKKAAEGSTSDSSDSLLWTLFSSLLSRQTGQRRDDAFPSESQQKEHQRGAFTQNYPSSASLVDSSRQRDRHQQDQEQDQDHPLQRSSSTHSIREPSYRVSSPSQNSSTTTNNNSNNNNNNNANQAHLREGILNSHAPPFFELLPLHLPADYPPPTPRIPDMEMRALALGVNHLAGDDVGPDTAWVLEKPARLEYLGDSVLELATRTLIFREVADLSPKTMAILKSHLVSNDILGHLYNQAGLETLRLDTAEWALETLRTQHPKSAIGPPPLHPSFSHSHAALMMKRRPPSSSSKDADEQHEAARRRRLALYLPDLPHSRKADLFEAYLGALYLSQPPSIASEWTQNLLRPFAARAMRHELMGIEEALTRAGVVRRRVRDTLPCLALRIHASIALQQHWE
ncbi:unnamed protein product [Tilletia controversa]|nr:unnamed protein product [Tilletia controversa]